MVKIRIFSFFFLVSAITFSQNERLTQVDVDTIMSKIGIENYTQEYIRQIYKRQPELLGVSALYGRIASSKFFAKDKELDSANYFADLAIKVYAESAVKRPMEEKQLGRAYFVKARCLRDQRDFYNSTKYLLKAIEIGKKYEYPWIGYYSSSIAINHLGMGDVHKALEVNLKLVNDTNFMKREGAKVFNRIGVIHSRLKHYDSAAYYYKWSLSRTELTRRSLFSVHINLGDVFRNLSMLDSAYIHYRKADSVAILHGINDEIVGINKAYLEQIKGNYRQAILSFEAAIEEAKSLEKIDTDDRDTFVFAFDNLINCHQAIGNYKLAVQVAQNKSSFLERHYRQRLDEQLSDLTVQYEVKEKDVSILRLEEKTAAQNTIIQQRNIITGSVIGLFVLLGTLGFLFYRKRQSDARYRLANTEQKLLRSQLNPHFLFNALNSIVSYSKANSNKTIPYTLKLASLLRSILHNSREEFVTIADELQSVEDYLELESDFSERFTYSIDFAHGIDTNEIRIPPMFIQPFIENSIKHGFCGKEGEQITVSMELKEDDKVIHCKVKDNGFGYSNAAKVKKNGNKHKSLSGTILEERLSLYSKVLKVKGYYTIEDRPESGGTNVDIFLPYFIED